VCGECVCGGGSRGGGGVGWGGGGGVGGGGGGGGVGGGGDKIYHTVLSDGHVTSLVHCFIYLLYSSPVPCV